MVLVRRANFNDVAEVSRLLKTLEHGEYVISDFDDVREAVKNDHVYVIGEKTLSAVIWLVVVKGSLQIKAIVSNQKGHGTLLVQMAETVCKNQGLPKLWCWSNVRYGAADFYRKTGFSEEYLLKKQWGGEDIWFFGKVIE